MIEPVKRGRGRPRKDAGSGVREFFSMERNGEGWIVLRLGVSDELAETAKPLGAPDTRERAIAHIGSAMRKL